MSRGRNDYRRGIGRIRHARLSRYLELILPERSISNVGWRIIDGLFQFDPRFAVIGAVKGCHGPCPGSVRTVYREIGIDFDTIREGKSIGL